MKLKLCFAGLFFALGITGCQSNTYTIDDLMQHPDTLQQAYLRCTNGENTNASQCTIVIQAAREFSSLAEERNQDPEKFGRRIMDLQAAMATGLKPDSAAYQQQADELRAMYAVIAATTQE